MRSERAERAGRAGERAGLSRGPDNDATRSPQKAVPAGEAVRGGAGAAAAGNNFLLAPARLRRSNAAHIKIMASRKGERRHPNAIHLTVASVPRAARFYEEKLGFKVVEAFPDKDKPVWASLVLGRQSLMLGELPSLQEARQLGMDQAEIEVLKQDARAFARGSPGVGVSYYVKVDDVDRFARRLKKRRLKPLLPPKTQFYGIRDCQVTDLDGYRIVFYSPAPPPTAPPAPDPA